MSEPRRFSPALCLSACWHARDVGDSVIEYDDIELVITRRPRTREPEPRTLTGDGMELLDTQDDYGAVAQNVVTPAEGQGGNERRVEHRACNPHDAGDNAQPAPPFPDDVPTLSEDDVLKAIEDTARRNRGDGDR